MTNPGGPTRFDRHPVLTGAALTLLLVAVVDVIWGSHTTSGQAGTPHPYLHHTLATNFSGTSTWVDQEAWIHTNSLGFRDAAPREVPLQDPRYRVLFLGDSFTEGVGVDYADTFVGRVAAAADPARLEVLNGGVVSLSPRLYRLKLEYLLEKVGLHVDEVAVFVDVSDAIDDLLYADFQPRDEFTWTEALGALVVRRSALGRRLMDHLPWTAAFRTVNAASSNPLASFQLRSRWSLTPEEFEPYGRLGLAASQREMLGLLALCRAHHIKVSLAVYPWPSHIFTRTSESPQRSAWAQFARDQGLTFMDAWPLFVDGSDPMDMIDNNFIHGDVHWNPRGHARMANLWLTTRCQDAPPDDLPCAALKVPPR